MLDIQIPFQLLLLIEINTEYNQQNSISYNKIKLRCFQNAQYQHFNTSQQKSKIPAYLILNNISRSN